MSYIRLKEATEILGVSDSSIPTGAKYKPFYKKKTKGTNESYFDIDGYRKRQSLEEELLAKTKLFVEYLVHIEETQYTFIAEKAQAKSQAISNHQFSLKKALNMLRWFRDYRPSSIKGFDDYYGWSHKMKRKPMRSKDI